MSLERQLDIVIPYGPTGAMRQGSLSAVVRALMQNEELHRCAIFVVQNGRHTRSSTEELRRLTRAFVSLRVLRQRSANLARARNYGAGRGHGEYLLFCDADTVPEPAAVRDSIRRATESSFVCGAIRRYIPLSVNSDVVLDLIARNRWEELDALSCARPSRTALTEASQRPGRPFEGRTYAGSFGIMPRSHFEAVGGFDDRYAGWGLEDVDLMRRLLGRIACTSWIDGRVWHLDHLIEPYHDSDLWDTNWPRYLAGVARDGFLMSDELFTRAGWICRDPVILAGPSLPRVNKRCLNRLALSPSHRRSLLRIVHGRLADANTCAVMLFGSARRAVRPRDIDINTVSFAHNAHAYQALDVDGVVIEEQVRSLSQVVAIFDHPGGNPDGWPFLFARYDPHWIVGSRADVAPYLQAVRTRALERFRYHLVTYHCGNALHEVRRTNSASQATAMRHYSVLVGLSKNSWPDRFTLPCFFSPSLARKVRAFGRALERGACEHATDLIRRTATQALAYLDSGRCQQEVIYAASAVGAEFLRDSRVGAPGSKGP